MSRHRVMFVSHSPAISGGERSMLELIDGLSSEFDCCVATPPSPLVEQLADRKVPAFELAPVDLSFRLHPIWTPLGLSWVPRTAVRLRALSRRHRVDLIHANTSRAALPAILAGVGRGAPAVVSHIRDGVPQGPLGRAVLGSIESLSDAVIANSRFIRAQLPRAPGKGHVVYNSVDADRFDPDRLEGSRVRRELGLGSDPIVVIVGHFYPHKAQDDAIRILAGLKSAHPDVRLMLVGSAKFTDRGTRYDAGSFYREIERLTLELGVEEDVVFAGERNDMPDVLAAADLLIAPSWYEPFGRCIVEAMAMGLPTVVTSEGGSAEIVRDGVDGFVRRPRDIGDWVEAVGRILANPGLAASMGESGRDRVRRSFRPESTVAAVRDVYTQLLSARGS